MPDYDECHVQSTHHSAVFHERAVEALLDQVLGRVRVDSRQRVIEEHVLRV